MIQIDNILQVEKYIDDMDAVIFDLDDTLYSEKEYVRSGYKKIAEYFKMPKMEDELWAVFEQGGKAIDEVLTAHALIEKREETLKIYRSQKPDIHLYDGVSDMIERIRKTKKIGIITDGRPEGQREKLKALGLMSIVDEIIITDELGGTKYRKPNKTAFVKMQETFGVEFAEMCYIGDNIKKDFIAPKLLGMRCIWIRNKNGLYYCESGR